MDQRTAIWNVLHDGEITAVSEDGDSFTMFVSIPYLRRRLQPLGGSLVLVITGLRKVEFRGFDGTSSKLREELEIGAPEILKTESITMPVTIETTMGHLILDFQGIQFALDSGQKTDYETVKRVCDDYWKAWQAKANRGKQG